MRRTPRAVVRPSSIVTGLLLALSVSFSFAPASADAVLGFRERFNGISSWGGGAVYTQPATGGADGEGDGFWQIATIGAGSCASRSFGSEYLGNWTAAGITQIRIWLNDVGAPQPLEIHVDLGGASNRWLYTPAFQPPNNAWAEFVVDLTNPANFTRIIGVTGNTFAQAMQSVEVLQVRHDNSPFVQNPNQIEAEYGIDNILLTNGLVGVEDRPASVRRALELDAPYPNPSRGPVSFAVQQHSADPLEITIVDVTGRRVRSAMLAAGGSGARVWMWDGRDEHGARVAPGAYRVTMRDGSGAVSRPLIRIE